MMINHARLDVIMASQHLAPLSDSLRSCSSLLTPSLASRTFVFAANSALSASLSAFSAWIKLFFADTIEASSLRCNSPPLSVLWRLGEVVVVVWEWCVEVRVLFAREGEDERLRLNMDERFGGGASTTGSLRPKSGILIEFECLVVGRLKK
jgi:hypothetical protein